MTKKDNWGVFFDRLLKVAVLSLTNFRLEQQIFNPKKESTTYINMRKMEGINGKKLSTNILLILSFVLWSFEITSAITCCIPVLTSLIVFKPEIDDVYQINSSNYSQPYQEAIHSLKISYNLAQKTIVLMEIPWKSFCFRRNLVHLFEEWNAPGMLPISQQWKDFGTYPPISPYSLTVHYNSSKDNRNI